MISLTTFGVQNQGAALTGFPEPQRPIIFARVHV